MTGGICKIIHAKYLPVKWKRKYSVDGGLAKMEIMITISFSNDWL